MVTKESLALERLLSGACTVVMPHSWPSCDHPGCPKDLSSEATQRSAMSFGSLRMAFVLVFSADSCEMTIFTHKHNKLNGFS